MKNKYEKNNSTNKILDALEIGTGLMIIQAPMVNAFNQWSVVACRYDLSNRSAFQFIYEGRLNGTGSSLLNFRAGMAGHFSKEVPRIFFKSTGLYIYKPWLNTQLTPNYVDITFAGTLALAEIFINPADTWRVNNQAGTKLTYSMSSLYAGSLANGARQFGTWWGFSYSNHILNESLSNYTAIDPHSITGILIKSYPQAIFFTSLVYGIERVKNELQYNSPQKNQNLFVKKSPYLSAASKIWQQQGMHGFFRGIHPKILSNTISCIGSNFLLELGQKNIQRPGMR